MKSYIFFLLFFITLSLKCFSQPLRIAILDFDNISGNAKYDGLGKAMSSMLISDIESNVSPKRLQLVERAQINKIMKEQNLQKTASFDKSTSVTMGKLLGVNYLLIGDIYILDNSLVINARLTNASTGDIKFSEKQEGKINEWLTVKTKLGKGVVTSISMPFTEPRIPDGIISPAVLTTYASAIEENDKGNYEKAETLISTAKEFNPDFGYLDDLKGEVEKLKKQVKELQVEVETSVENPISAAFNFKLKNDLKTANKYLYLGLSRLNNSQYGKKYIYFRLLAEYQYLAGEYEKSINYSDSILSFYQFDDNAIFYKTMSLLNKGKSDAGLKIIKEQLINYQNACQRDVFNQQIKSFEKLNIVEFSGINISQYTDCPFEVSIYGISQVEGEYFYQGVFSRQLNRYVEACQFLKKSPIQIAEEVNLLRLREKQSQLPKSRVESPFYLPLSRFSSNTTKGNEFIVVETGNEYSGNYFSTYDGKYYTGSAPSQCPCQLLLTKTEYENYINSLNNTNELTLDNSFERDRIFQLGWLYLLAKAPDKSISQFSKLIEFYTNKVKSFSDFQALSSAEKDMWRMSKINIGHAYLLNNDFINALDFYKKSELKIEFKGFNNMSAKQVILYDWSDLKEKGILSENTINNFKSNSNNLFE
jgi:TolB-like protein